MSERTYQERVNSLSTSVVHWNGEHLFAHKGEVYALAAEADAALASAKERIEALEAALKNCLGVLGGYDMTKSALEKALERGRAALTQNQKEEKRGGELE